MLFELISKIQTTLQSVTQVKEIIPHPIDNIDQLTKYPAVVFFQDDFANQFETNAENAKIYRFQAFVFIGLNQENAEKVFTDALPKTVDAIIAAFDANWDQGTINGHRIWCLVEGGRPDIDVAGKGKVAWQPLTIRIKGLTTN